MRIRGESRTSTAIIDPTSGLQTEVNEHGPVVTARELHSFIEKFSYIAKGADVVILAGSLPRKVKDSLHKVHLSQYFFKSVSRRVYSIMGKLNSLS